MLGPEVWVTLISAQACSVNTLLSPDTVIYSWVATRPRWVSKGSILGVCFEFVLLTSWSVCRQFPISWEEPVVK